MADKKGDKKTAPPPAEKQDLATWLIGLLFIAIILGALVSRFEGIGAMLTGSSGGSFSLSAFGTQLKQAITGDIIDGSMVSILGHADVWDTVGARGKKIGEQARGSIGRVFDGPEVFKGGQWWLVDFETGLDGWVDEDALRPQGGFISRSIALIITVCKWVGGIIALACVIGIVYAQRGLGRLRKKQKEYLTRIDQELVDTRPSNARWEKVLAQTASTNPGDWRLAIIEADIMLDELVTGMGYHGDSLGEKLKVIEISDFSTLEKAWEAHKIRNRIAHGGSDFILTQRETGRIIDLYRQVFEEFNYI